MELNGVKPLAVRAMDMFHALKSRDPRVAFNMPPPPDDDADYHTGRPPGPPHAPAPPRPRPATGPAGPGGRGAEYDSGERVGAEGSGAVLDDMKRSGAADSGPSHSRSGAARPTRSLTTAEKEKFAK